MGIVEAEELRTEGISDGKRGSKRLSCTDKRRRCAGYESAAIRAVVRTAINKGMKVKGIMRGYAGLLQEEMVDMDGTSVGY